MNTAVIHSGAKQQNEAAPPSSLMSSLDLDQKLKHRQQMSDDDDDDDDFTPDNDASVTKAVLQGIAACNLHTKDQAKSRPPIEVQDQMLNEAFHPSVPIGEEIEDISPAQYASLQSSLREFIRSDDSLKTKTIMQHQLAEYHTLLDHMSALSMHCRALDEQNSLLRNECHKRDYKIAALLHETRTLRLLIAHRGRQESLVGGSGLTHQQIHHQQHQLQQQYLSNNVQGVQGNYSPSELQTMQMNEQGRHTMSSESEEMDITLQGSADGRSFIR